MLGVLQSYNVTNVLLIAVRYFGGIKLGTSGLIEAYRAVSELALSQSNIIEKTEDVVWSFKFDYSQMNKVMSSVKSLNITVLESSFDLKCMIKLQAPKSIMSRLQSEISDVVINEGE
jgi:putative IMPACT (imprinted ancient) family translation regulator